MTFSCTCPPTHKGLSCEGKFHLQGKGGLWLRLANVNQLVWVSEKFLAQLTSKYLQKKYKVEGSDFFNSLFDSEFSARREK